MEDYLLSVIRGRRGVKASLLRGVLSGLSLLHHVGLECYLGLYKIGFLKQKRLPCVVICVGNLTTGGTGKTPTVQRLCRALLAAKRRVVILSRGYGGANEYGCAVVSDGTQILLEAKEAGDEAFLLAKTLPGVPVVVGKDRRVTGALACERFQPDVIVMDDGMQFWWLYKDYHICLLNACAPFDNGYLFPRGLLREPKSHLRRAQIIVLTNTRRAAESTVASLLTEIKSIAPHATLLTTDLIPIALQAWEGGERQELEWLRGKRVVTIAALGNPASFEEMVAQFGANIVKTNRYRDHFALDLPELGRVADEAQQLKADLILTTEKDAVKFPVFHSPIPIYTLQVEMDLDCTLPLSLINRAIER